MQGEIGAESEEGVGSTFWFCLTLPRGEHSDVRIDMELNEHRPVGQTARILLVEDLDINQELATLILTRAGHRVDIASDGAEAVQAVQRTSYDMVLMDIQMPVMDGMTATARIRELSGPVQHIPIIAMTANVLPEQIARFRQTGMNDHVGKPFRPAELLETVERWLPEIVLDLQTSTAEASITGLDLATYDELVSLIGEQRVHALLGRLEKLLATNVEPEGSTDVARIAADAHALVSVAGMLGFKNLSDASRDLEHACLTQNAIDDVLAHSRDLCRAALLEIAILRRGVQAA
jgi:CheY-like chemotaxis protein/HPt (histidine-containing phosphotransfer) domain-containing protein